MPSKQRAACSTHARDTFLKNMRLALKILFIGFIVVAFIFTAAHIFLILQGRALVTRRIEALTNKKVTIGDFAITPLLKIEIKNLQIQDMGKVDSVYIVPSMLGLLTGVVAFNDVQIINPDLIIEKFKQSQNEETIVIKEETNPPVVSSKSVAKARVKISEEQIGHIRAILKRLSIKNGRINFVDHTVGDKGIKLTFKDVDFTVTDLYLFPRSAVAEFDLKASIPWQAGQEEGSIRFWGWVNFYKKNMKADLKISGIDGVYLYPYYSSWVDLDKARIEKAKLNFTSDISGSNNNLTAVCHLELTDIVRLGRPSDQQPEKAEKIATAILDIFKALDKGKIVLDFTIRTKMDRPELGFGQIRMAFEEKLANGLKERQLSNANVLMFPANILERAVKSATDITGAVIAGTAGIGTEIKKALQAAFRREPKPKE